MIEPIGGGDTLSLSLKPLPILKRILGESAGLAIGVDLAKSVEVDCVDCAFFSLAVIFVVLASGRLSQVREPSALENLPLP